MLDSAMMLILAGVALTHCALVVVLVGGLFMLAYQPRRTRWCVHFATYVCAKRARLLLREIEGDLSDDDDDFSDFGSDVGDGGGRGPRGRRAPPRHGRRGPRGRGGDGAVVIYDDVGGGGGDGPPPPPPAAGRAMRARPRSGSPKLPLSMPRPAVMPVCDICGPGVGVCWSGTNGQQRIGRCRACQQIVYFRSHTGGADDE